MTQKMAVFVCESLATVSDSGYPLTSLLFIGGQTLAGKVRYCPNFSLSYHLPAPRNTARPVLTD